MKSFQKLLGDIEKVRGLADKYRPVIDKKVKEYEPLIKNDMNNMKDSFKTNVLPGMQKMTNQFKNTFKGIKK